MDKIIYFLENDGSRDAKATIYVIFLHFHIFSKTIDMVSFQLW